MPFVVASGCTYAYECSSEFGGRVALTTRPLEPATRFLESATQGLLLHRTANQLGTLHTCVDTHAPASISRINTHARPPKLAQHFCVSVAVPYVDVHTRYNISPSVHVSRGEAPRLNVHVRCLEARAKARECVAVGVFNSTSFILFVGFKSSDEIEGNLKAMSYPIIGAF